MVSELNIADISQAQQNLPTPYGTFVQHTFIESSTGQRHLVLAMGSWCENEPIPVRIHSECLTGEVFGSLRCDCGDQLQLTLNLFQSRGVGLLIYLRQEGRGIGLVNKIKAYELQDQGLDTVEANLALGFPVDDRRYDCVVGILKTLRVGSIELLTNNPDKIVSMENLGINVVARIPIEPEVKPESLSYMRTKMERMGHLLSSTVEE